MLQLLSNSLVLSHTTPHLSPYDVLNLAASSRYLRYLVYNSPQVFRRLDLGKVKAAQFDILGIDSGGEVWRNVQLDEHLTEDEYVFFFLFFSLSSSFALFFSCFLLLFSPFFPPPNNMTVCVSGRWTDDLGLTVTDREGSFYSGPLRNIFTCLRRANLLQDVQTLVLDGLSVTAELVHEIINDSSFAVRILSIRGVRNMNEYKLRQALEYACRSSRPEGTPRLKGLYVFGAKDSPSSPAASRASKLAGPQLGQADSDEAQDAWYVRRGSQFEAPSFGEDWANTLAACEGMIAFDAVLCGGPKHHYSPSNPGLIPHQAIAVRALDGCAECGAAPEGWTVWGEETAEEREQRGPSCRRDSGSCATDAGRFPLLAPPPFHSSSIRAAMCPSGQPVYPRLGGGIPEKNKARFIPRCQDCLRERYCGGCHRWWCEGCYAGPRGHAGQEAQEQAQADLVSNSPSTHHTQTSRRGGEPEYKVRSGFCVDRACRVRSQQDTSWFNHRVGSMALQALHAPI